MAQNYEGDDTVTSGIARPSDYEKLDEFDDKVKNARRN